VKKYSFHGIQAIPRITLLFYLSFD